MIPAVKILLEENCWSRFSGSRQNLYRTFDSH